MPKTKSIQTTTDLRDQDSNESILYCYEKYGVSNLDKIRRALVVCPGMDTSDKTLVEVVFLERVRFITHQSQCIVTSKKFTSCIF